MIPTKQQQNFYDIISGARKVPGDWSGNISIQAVAGSGKTTTAVAGAKHASKRYKRIGFTAFNKSIADELGKRLVGSAQASTLHSLGNRLIRQKFNFVSLEQDKYKKIAKSEFPSYFQSKAGSSKGYFLKPEYASLFALIEMIRVQNIPVDYLSAELMDKVQVCADKTGIALPSKEFVQEVVGAAFRCLEIGSDPALLPSHGIDFSDMIWLPVRLDLGSNIFDLLLADEAQDFNKVQQDLVCRVSQNTVIIGDECQPPGTIVKVVSKRPRGRHTAKFNDVKIEDLRVGDTVYSYCSQDAHFYASRKVAGITKRHYDGEMIVCRSNNGIETRYTENHICIASFDGMRHKFCVYIMSKGDQFRIGRSKFATSLGAGGQSGPIARMKQEGADKLWLIGCFDTKVESAVFEQSVSGKFGIPQTVFSSEPLKTKGFAEEVWNYIGNNRDRAEVCLRFFHRNINYPLFVNKFDFNQSLKRSIKVRACNLMSGCKMIVYKGNANAKKEDWIEFDVSREHYAGDVYSLDVDKYHTYIADGIVTHNCQAIQGWAGADCQSFPNMTKRLKARKMPLSVCWRCPSSHLDLARLLVPHIEASPTAQRGEIDEFDSYQVPRVVAPGDLIICRNNAPLIGAAYNMMRSKVPCLVRGKDIGASMLQLVEKLDPMDIKDLHHRLQRWQEREIKKLFDRDAHETAYQLVNDQVECIRELAQDCDNIGEFTEICKTLFTDTDETGKVILSSVHRAKGLESDRVVLLKPELMCTRASDQEAYQQEKNLLYVALTRAKSRLTFADGPGSCRPDLHSWVSEIASSDMPIRRRV